ncbi:hypothetical protein HID58_062406, partial [Brassica napus]
PRFNKALKTEREYPRRPVARPRVCQRRWFTFFRLSQGSPLWASIYRFPRHADGSGLGFGAKKGSACTMLHTAALLFSLDPWLSQLYDRRPLFLGDGGSVSTVIAGSCSRKAVAHLILKASKLFRLLISHLKRLVNVGGVGSMVDGSHESTQIVFDVCLVLSVWDTVHLC